MGYVGLEGIGRAGLNASLSGLFYRSTEKRLDGTSGGATRSASFLVNVNKSLNFIHPGTLVGGRQLEIPLTDPRCADALAERPTR
jgi:hypothetical protein